jgi:hypothetical protein
MAAKPVFLFPDFALLLLVFIWTVDPTCVDTRYYLIWNPPLCVSLGTGYQLSRQPRSKFGLQLENGKNQRSGLLRVLDWDVICLEVIPLEDLGTFNFRYDYPRGRK